MYAIFRALGKQYRAEKGKTLRLPLMDAAAGSKVTFDEVLLSSNGETIKTGGYSYVAKGMTHYAFFPEETVIQLHGIGPQGITYVNPADDPRKK